MGLHSSWSGLTLAAHYHPRFILSIQSSTLRGILCLRYSLELWQFTSFLMFLSTQSCFIFFLCFHGFCTLSSMDLLSTSWQRFPLWKSICNQLIHTMLHIVAVIQCIWLGYISITIYYPNLLSLVSVYSNTSFTY